MDWYDIQLYDINWLFILTFHNCWLEIIIIKVIIKTWGHCLYILSWINCDISSDSN